MHWGLSGEEGQVSFHSVLSNTLGLTHLKEFFFFSFSVNNFIFKSLTLKIAY
jgi:hypothetical protein